jgi:hypothetical protein
MIRNFLTKKRIKKIMMIKMKKMITKTISSKDNDFQFLYKILNL